MKPGPALVTALIVTLLLGIFFSPITAVSRVQVEGARPVDRQTIEGVLRKLNAIPWAVVNVRWVETRVQQIQAVEHARYSQNIFGRGRLEVVYRTPVARVKGKQSVAMDGAGVMFLSSEAAPDLPVVVRPDSAKDLPMTLAGGFPAGQVAELAIRAKQFAPQSNLVIWFNNRGAVCLNVGTCLLILGSCDDLDAKFRALKKLIEQQPDLLGQLDNLNLTEPSHPATTYKRQRT